MARRTQDWHGPLPGWLRRQPLARSARVACVTLALGAGSWAPMVAHADTADWWISLGVYASPTAAGRAASGLGEQRQEAPRVVAFEQGGRTLHRVAVGPYEAGQPLQAALQDWRREMHGAFAVQLGAAPAVAAPVPAGSAAVAPLVAAEAAPVSADAATADAATADAATTRTAAPAPSPEAAVAPVPVTLAPAGPPPPVDPMAGLRLDPAMERLLRDDVALQRELERLSRGLPRGLGSEIEAAQAHGVSLREVRERAMTGPASPSVAPPGYQLHHLRRDDAVPEGAPGED